MALLGEDGRGYELARKLESHGVWRTWLGDSLYSNFIHFLTSPSAWESFMRSDSPISESSSTSAVDSLKTRAHLQLQLRARALLFDKASISLFLRSTTTNNPQLSSSSIAISNLNPNYLQLHGDDVYFTLEEAAQRSDNVSATANTTSSKSKSSFAVGSRHTESEVGSLSQKFKFDELPETWYSQFFEKYRVSKSYRLSFGDQETEKRTPEQMYTYAKVAEKHKRMRVAFKVDQNIGVGNSMSENGSNVLLTSIIEDNNTLDSEAPFFPETMFTMNCVPDSAVLRKRRAPMNQKVEFNGVLDTLPQIVTKSPIMIERLGIRPEYLSMNPGGHQNRGKIGYDGRRKLLGQEQASQLSQKVIVRFLDKVGFDGSSEVPLEVLSQLLSCHVHKLGCTLKLLADSYKKQCSAMELLKMFLHTTGYSNFAVLSELVKDTTRTSVSQIQQQVPGVHLQSQNQGPLRQSQQIPRQMHPQLQQILNPQNLAFQQQWERMKRRQQSTPRPGMSVNMTMDKDRPMVEVKVENPSEFSMENNTFATINSRNPQLQQFRQQQLAAAMTSFPAQTSNQFRPMSSLQIPQMQSPTMGMVVRAPPVKVEGFQELMGGDATLKPDSDENKLTSPSK